MAIVGAMPNTIANGQIEDATPVMANFNWLMNQVNANAAPVAGLSTNPFATAALVASGLVNANLGLTVTGGNTSVTTLSSSGAITSSAAISGTTGTFSSNLFPGIDIQFGAGGTVFTNNQILRHTNTILYAQGGAGGLVLNRDSTRADYVDIGSTVNQIDTVTAGTTKLRVNATGINAMSSLGYGIPALGVGGSVTQITSITTAVTLNKICGSITTVSNTFVSATPVSFVLNNNFIAATDTIILSCGNAPGIMAATASGVSAGSATITLFPYTGVTGGIVINFSILKAVTS